MPTDTDTDFTPEEAIALIEEWASYLTKAEVAVKAGRFVEADSWTDRLKTGIDEQDVFGMMAAQEVADSVRHIGS